MAKMVKRKVNALTVICKRLCLWLLRAGAGDDDDVRPVIVVLILLVFIDEHIRLCGLR